MIRVIRDARQQISMIIGGTEELVDETLGLSTRAMDCLDEQGFVAKRCCESLLIFHPQRIKLGDTARCPECDKLYIAEAADAVALQGGWVESRPLYVLMPHEAATPVARA